jgi:PAS domain S-box-containing protein
MSRAPDFYDPLGPVFATPESFAGPIGAALAWETAVAAACLAGAVAGFTLGRIRRREEGHDGDRGEQSRLPIHGVFSRISFLLGQALSRRETLEVVARAATDVLPGVSAAVFIRAGERLETVEGVELPAPLAELVARGADENAGPRPLVDHAAQASVIAVPSLAGDARLPAEWRAGEAARGHAALLAISIDEPRGRGKAQLIVFFEEERIFTDDELEVARYLADASRDALRRAEVIEAERSGRVVAEQLTRTGRLLAVELDPATVLDEVVEQAPRLVEAEACAIRLLEGDELVVAAANGPGSEGVEGFRSSALGWLCGDVVQSGAPVALPAAGDDPRLREIDPLLAGGHLAYLGVPLEGAEGASLGALAVYSPVARVWEPHEIEALQALAAGTSAALANAGLYRAIALEKERGAAILANIVDGIVAVDHDGAVVLWNAAAERITGVAAADALGRKPAAVLQRAIESPDGTVADDRLVPIMRGREEVWLSISEAVMRDPGGAVAGRVFAFRDISADRLVEQVKSDFVTTVSHELRTPLTSIYGFAETLLRRDVAFSDEERGTFLGYIASESQRLAAIVDSLLGVARLDSGDLEVRLSAIDVRAVAGQAAEALRAAEENGHRVVVDLPEDPVRATADPEKLRQVLSILLDNALRYSPDGGTVTLEVVRSLDVVEIRVTDEGVGIPHSEQEQVFRKFYRGSDAGLRAGAGGTGLGLFIARGLVTAMGGRIWVAPRDGGGTRLALELPVARSGE